MAVLLGSPSVGNLAALSVRSTAALKAGKKGEPKVDLLVGMKVVCLDGRLVVSLVV